MNCWFVTTRCPKCSPTLITYPTPQEVTYGSGFVLGLSSHYYLLMSLTWWSPGRLVTDTVQLGSLPITGQGLGAALLSEGFDGVDGILGYVLCLLLYSFTSMLTIIFSLELDLQTSPKVMF